MLAVGNPLTERGPALEALAPARYRYLHLAAHARIDDRWAADFMRDFYDELHAGRAPADALHAVRRHRIEAGGPAAHPSYWAPFVLVGEG